MDLLYGIIGALISTWIIYNIFNIALFKFLDKKTLKYISFVGSAIFILVFTSYTMGFVNGFITFIPFLFIWFLIDLIKLNKKATITEEKSPSH